MSSQDAAVQHVRKKHWVGDSKRYVMVSKKGIDLPDSNHGCRQRCRNQEMVDSGVRKLREKGEKEEVTICCVPGPMYLLSHTLSPLIQFTNKGMELQDGK